MRVLVAGFKHETNTFASNRADWSAFERGEGLPKPVHGEALLDMISTVDVSASGFVHQARDFGWTIVPGFWCGAVPSSYITAAAFEKICDAIIADVRQLDFDAIYLDLHGAAMAESFDDAEGELLKRIRDIVGQTLPIVASLDLLFVLILTSTTLKQVSARLSCWSVWFATTAASPSPASDCLFSFR